MQNEHNNEIYTHMQVKTNEELIQIWQENDHVAWHDEVFDIIAELLQERLGELPPQNEPIYTENQREEKKLALLQAKTVIYGDPDNQPEFYDPVEIMKLDQWLKWASILIVISTFLANFRLFYQEALYFFYVFKLQTPSEIIVVILSSVITILMIVGTCILFYFVLNALRLILKILMQMEFTSRGVKL